MIRSRSAIAICAVAAVLSSSGCFLIDPDFNGDGEVTIEDLDAVIAACNAAEAVDGGTDEGPPDDAEIPGGMLPGEGTDEESDVTAPM